MSIAVESFTSDKYGIVYHNRPPHRPEECLALSQGDSTHSECAVFFRIIPRNFSIGPVMVSPIPSSQEAPELAGER